MNQRYQNTATGGTKSPILSVTIATGDIRYYKLAYNLLKSYHYHTPKEERLPFAIITDKTNDYCQAFDDVVVVDGLKHSYMSKIQTLITPPITAICS